MLHVIQKKRSENSSQKKIKNPQIFAFERKVGYPGRV